MPTAHLYQFTIHKRNKIQFERKSHGLNKSEWNLVLRNPSELKEKITLNARADGFNIEEQCKFGDTVLGEIPYYLLFRNPNRDAREYSLNLLRGIINVDDIF